MIFIVRSNINLSPWFLCFAWNPVILETMKIVRSDDSNYASRIPFSLKLRSITLLLLYSNTTSKTNKGSKKALQILSWTLSLLSFSQQWNSCPDDFDADEHNKIIIYVNNIISLPFFLLRYCASSSSPLMTFRVHPCPQILWKTWIQSRYCPNSRPIPSRALR